MYLWIGGSVIVVIGLVVAGYFVFQSKHEATNNSTNIVVDDATGLARRALDGVKVAAAEANLFPISVMIENLDVTRPQSGLSQAGVVYEAPVEGGITRFLAVFATSDMVTEIGPVRSARPYYVEWAKEYDGVYVHAGGSPQGLARIKELEIRDFSQFYNAGSFIEKAGKARPHHLFTNSTLLGLGFRDKDYPDAGPYRTWQFKDDAPIAERPNTQTISLDFSNFNYQVDYAYDKTTNTYVRSQAQVEAKDEATGKTIAPKNVIVQYVAISKYDEQRLDITDVGSGTAIIFRDGKATTGTWSKKDASARTLFYDANGTEIEFNAGQTWVEVIEKDRENVTYS
jgi:hypothetical protein